MSTYAAPLTDMQFVIRELIGLDAIAALPGCEEVSADLVDAVLGEAAKFAQEVLDPLNQSGDRQGARLVDGKVAAPDGFGNAYRQFIAAGWNGLARTAGVRRAGTAAQRRDAGAGNVEQRQHGVLPVPDAHQRRHGGAACSWHAAAAGNLAAEAHVRRVDAGP